MLAALRPHPPADGKGPTGLTAGPRPGTTGVR